MAQAEPPLSPMADEHLLTHAPPRIRMRDLPPPLPPSFAGPAYPPPPVFTFDRAATNQGHSSSGGASKLPRELQEEEGHDASEKKEVPRFTCFTAHFTCFTAPLLLDNDARSSEKEAPRFACFAVHFFLTVALLEQKDNQ